MADSLIDGRGSGNSWAVDEDHAGYMKTLDSTGKVSQGPLGRYVSVERDVSDINSQYSGFEAADGTWYIMLQTTSGGDARIQSSTFAVGTTDLGSNWANRATQTYNSLGSVF